jgi:hypothetical protein
VRPGARDLAAAAAGSFGAAALWLVLTVGHFAVGYGYGDVRRGSGYPRTPSGAVRRVLEPTLDWLRGASDTFTGILLRERWLALLAGVLAALVVAGIRVGRDGRDAPDDASSDRSASEVTA